MKSKHFLMPLLCSAFISALSVSFFPAQAVSVFPADDPAPASANNKGYKITGAVNDPEDKPVAYATVALYTTDSTARPVTAVVTDDRGRFTLTHKTEGVYKLSVAGVGFGVWEQQIILAPDSPSVEVGTVVLAVKAVEAQAVTVTAQAPLVTSDIDKISYNLDSDPETPSLTVLEMMRKVPLLSVDGEDNIRFKGESNFKILLNGKTSMMVNNKNYKDVLRSMPAGSVKRIEVITNPPAKYDAEGITGIINIVTERTVRGAYNGTVGVSARMSTPEYWGGSGYGYVNAGFGKFSLGANLSVYQGAQPQYTSSSLMTNLVSDTYRYTYSQAHGSSKYSGLNGSLELSYEVDSLNLLTLSLSANQWGNGRDGSSSVSETRTTDIDGNLQREYVNRTNSKYGGPGMGLSIDYQRSFKKPDETLTFSYQFSFSKDPSTFFNDIQGLTAYPSRQERGSNTEFSREHTFQIDFFNPINTKHTVEAGMKYIMRPNNSDTERELWNGADWELDLSNVNNIDYTQGVGSLYAGYRFKLKKIGVKTGVRGEYTLNEGNFRYLNADNKLHNEYFNLIPYVTFNYKPTQQQNITVSYTQRLSRPGIYQLNPYLNDSDPEHWSSGNPNLEAAVGHSFSASYGTYKPKYNINFSLAATFVDNAIQRVSTASAEGVTLATYENTGSNNSYGGYLNFMVNPWNYKLTFSANLGGTFGVSKGQVSGVQVQRQGWSWSGFANINSQPWKNTNISAYGGLWRSGPSLTSTTNYLYYYYGVSVSQWLLKRTLQVSLSASSPFPAHRTSHWNSVTPTFTNEGRSYSYQSSYSVSLRWRFGKANVSVKKANRSVSNDDLSSGGNKGGSSGGGGGQ